MNDDIQNLTEELFDLVQINNCDIGTNKQCSKYDSAECYYCENKYPEITPELYLKLACLLEKHDMECLTGDYEETKKVIIRNCLIFSTCEICVDEKEQEEFKEEIRELFKN